MVAAFALQIVLQFNFNCTVLTNDHCEVQDR